MQFEKVHTIRDFYDGVRSGTADFGGLPHYFSCLFDEVADDYSDRFVLHPVPSSFMERELRHWTIFRAWESRFHLGLVPLETHRGHGGVDAEYDELGHWLDAEINLLAPVQPEQRAEFQAVGGQDDLPAGILRQLKVRWRPVLAER